MHKNFYLFQGLINEISPLLKNSSLVSAFTAHKNELILELEKQDKKYQLILSLDASFPAVNLQDAVNYKSPVYKFFEEAHGSKIISVSVIPYNKYLIIDLENYEIHGCFYGVNQNIFLMDKSFVTHESFKSVRTGIQAKPESNVFTISLKLVEKIIENKPNSTLIDLFLAICPGFNYRMLDEICFRLQYVGDEKLKTIDDPLLIFNEVKSFIKEIKSGVAYIYKNNSKSLILLYKSQSLIESNYQFEKFDSINKAWRIFLRENLQTGESGKLQRQIKKALDKRIKTLQTALQKISEAENIEERKAEAELKGNLILSNKHKIPRGASSVELTNIFSDGQEKILIKLNPKKKAVENAQYYFEKYSNISEKKQVVKIKKDLYAGELAEMKALDEKLEDAGFKELNKIKEKLIHMNIIQSDTVKAVTADNLKYSFKRLILEKKWDIYIGKNGENNDLLTFTFANKWDIWLHAQGVAGAHVIIKAPGKDVTVPVSIIEQAAQIAAANSDSKHASTVPVIYTQVRYVNRVRKALPGTVNVRNEKVIFVKPLSMNL